MSRYDTKTLIKNMEKLEADLFNEQQHYGTLKESYDRLYEYLAHVQGVSQVVACDNFLNWSEKQ